MATIKSFTDISQSKKLAEILPLESADMGWNVFVDGTTRILPIDDWDLVKDGSGNVKFYPAWSLAALRNLLPTAIKPYEDTYLFESHNTFDNSWVYRYHNEDDTSYLYCKNTNEVDACYEMIIKLNELKML